MIKITNELLESTQASILRYNGQFPIDMFIRLSDEMKEENRVLYNSLMVAAHQIADDMIQALNMPEDVRATIVVNNVWLAFITYNTIKQQMLSNELSGI